MLHKIHRGFVESITFFLRIIIPFFSCNDPEEVWLDRAILLISALVLGFQPSILCGIIDDEFFFCLVSVVFGNGRYSLPRLLLLIVSYEHRLYLHPFQKGCTAFRLLNLTLVVEPSAIRGLAADYRFGSG